MASDVQNVRAFGSENQTQPVATVVNNKLTTMRQNHEVTLEYHRIGALHGVLLDADGSSEIYDLFAEFGVTEQTQAFALATATTDVRAKCIAVARQIESALGASTYTRIRAICGATWFDKLIGHDAVKDAYHRYQDSVNLRNDPRNGFEFGGITFEEYRGAVGSTNFINASQARFFPEGVPGLFKTYYAPANFMETVNTVGLPMYAKQVPDPSGLNRFVTLHTQQNPLCMCTRPLVLVKGTTN